MSSSGVSCQKSLIIRAWRERWSDVQWSIHAKRLLKAPGAHAEAANQLAELLMQQVFLGSSPNMTVMTYLRHAVSTQMVTVASVVALIVKYDSFDKIYCTRALLDLVENFSKRASTMGTLEDSLQVARALLSLLQWLLNLLVICISKVNEDKSAAEYCVLVEKIAAILDTLHSSQHTVALLHVGHLEDESMYDLINIAYCKINGSISKLSAGLSADGMKKLRKGIAIVTNIPSFHLPMQAIVDAGWQSLNTSLNVLLNIEAIMKSTNEIAPFVEQILIVESNQGLNRPTLYCELLRTSLSGMVDSSGGPEELRWAAFTFLKIPQVLMQLVKREDTEKKSEDDKESLLFQGFSMLLNYIPFLDLTDTKCGVDCMHFLLNEVCTKYSLLSEAQCQALTKRRQAERKKSPKSAEQQNSQSSANLILRAEYTVTSILKTLDVDYSKNQDDLLGVLCHMISGKSFELILAAAAATGTLQSFAIKLIKFNEFSKQTTGEAGKGAQTRLLLFDISFLMLCHFTQLYGTEFVCSHPDSQSSFFLQWATRCLPEGGKYKSPDLFTPPDPAKVDALLAQINPGGELKINQTRWQEVCQHTPHAVQQVLNAWEYGALTDAQVKTIIENVKSRLCCLPVVVSVYLCSVVNLLATQHRSKALAILSQLRQPSTPASPTSSSSGAGGGGLENSPAGSAPGKPAHDYYSERSNLMSNIVAKVVQAVLPVEQRVAPDYELVPTSTPAYTALTDTFREVFQRGMIDIRATRKMDYLLNLTGPKWFSQHLVNEMLTKERPEELSKALGITYALFNLDLESLVLSLVLHTVPNLLQGTGSRLRLLTDPKGKTLAQLTVMALVLLHKHNSMAAKDTSHGALGKRGRKRTLSQMSFEEKDFDDERPIKMRKQEDEGMDTDDPFSFFPPPSSQKEDSPEKGGPNLKDPINKALLKLFRILSAILSCQEVNQRTGFVVSFIKVLFKSGKENVRWILQFMPVSMISQLLNLMGNDCNATFILALCDLSTSQGRKVATKVISQNARKQSSSRRSDMRVGDTLNG